MTKILLFADGTGNAVTTQESNVWRIYQALDPSAEAQIALYIPGVGTSDFKPWAILDGATGFGVSDNVLKLYHFLSWNWSPGDEIYMFGFSRGSFTIRLLIDLVYKEGLQPGAYNGAVTTSARMHRNAKKAWDSYQKNDDSRLKNIWVWLRRLGRKSQATPKGANIPITFVGLFDTVEAYGVPIEELREAVNTFLFPISFGNDRQIAPNVRCVRHALSLDDERTSFHPIRIDQSGQAPGSDARVHEVWFAGVHSDVGGGYPDDAVAHTPLVWMLEEAQRLAPPHPRGQGPVLKRGALAAFRRTATSFAPLHDSRSGAAVLYRYDPRSIDSMATSSYGPTFVHYSVVERMAEASCAYAPVVLPSDAYILLPDRASSTYGVTSWTPVLPASPHAPLDSPARLAVRQTRAAAALNNLPRPNRATLNIAWDYVWRRRANYLTLVSLLALLLSLPWTGEPIEEALTPSSDAGGGAGSSTAKGAWGAITRVLDGGINLLQGAAELALSITPPILEPWVRAIFSHPWIGGALIILFVALLRRAGALKELIHDLARRAWVTGVPALTEWPLNRIVRMLRLSSMSSWLHRQYSQWAAPLAFSIMIFGMLLAVANRLWFNGLVGAGFVCLPTPGSELVWLGPDAQASKPGYSRERPKGFATNNPCWASGFGVERGAAYRLKIEIDAQAGDEPWLDRLTMTDVDGFDGASLIHRFATPFRRWPLVAWFQPIARIGERGAIEWPLASNVHDEPLAPHKSNCSPLPRNFEKTQEHAQYCALLATAEQRAACMNLNANLKWSDAAPRDEMTAIRAAWDSRDFPHAGGRCRSVYPRRALASDFVAQRTGELFVFVNDAVLFPWGPTPQGFYTNNSGTATVTLQRLP